MKYIILYTLHECELDQKVWEIEEIVACDENGCLKTFDTMVNAERYQSECFIDGEVIQLPTY